jgi:hypothetical protein
LNVIQCAIFAEEYKLDARFVVMKVTICYVNYAYQNITRNTFEFWKRVSTFSVKAGTKMKTDNRADEITLVEDNDDNYDCESDVSELHMPAT